MAESLPSPVVLGNPENRRVAMFLEEADRLALPTPTVISWEDCLRSSLLDDWTIPTGSLIRIESPGENPEVEAALVRCGDDTGELVQKSHGEVARLRDWYRGWCATLRRIRDLAGGCFWMNHPDDIALMFHKLHCQQMLLEAGVPVPRLLGAIESYDHLRSVMREQGAGRVFVKPCHGSSASGVLAVESSGSRVQVTTSVEMNDTGGQLRLFNNLRVRSYREEAEIIRLVNRLAEENIYAEQWVPKAGWQGRNFDLRIVVIAGEPCHAVMRSSRSPLTNLHLGNERGDLEEWRRQLPGDVWSEIEATCRQVAGLFPRSLYFGLDVLLTPDCRSHVVLEVNAFGDLLPGILHNGANTYAAELIACRERFLNGECSPS